MRNKAALGCLLAVVGVVAAAFGGDDAATTVTYHLARPGAETATKADAEWVATVLNCRFNDAGLTGIEIDAPRPDAVTLNVPSALAARRDEIFRLAECRGRLEFRIRAGPELERKWREIDQASGGLVKPPETVAWYEFNDDSAPKILVITPERLFDSETQRIARHLKAASQPYQDALKKQKDAAADSSKPHAEVERLGAETDRIGAKLLAESAEYRDAKARYDDVVRNEVFTGSEIERAESHRQATQNVVYFGFREDRRDVFAAFTERHIKEQLAIILDGKVISAPVIKSRLPGEGIIQGGGVDGFTPSEAKELAAILSGGWLPVRLIRVKAPETK